MGVDIFPPVEAAAPLSSFNVLTRGQVQPAVAVNKELTSIDPGNNASFLEVNTMFGSALGGAEFVANILSNDTRLVFERKPYGAVNWIPTPALDTANGWWDWMHRVSDSGGLKSFVVPANGAQDLRMRRASGTSLTPGTCVANAIASHNAFPTPPAHYGMRDITLMVRNFTIGASLLVVPFDLVLENDDRTRTTATGQGSTFVRAGRRWWLHSWDAAYAEATGTDDCRVFLLSNRNGAVGAVGGAASGSAQVLHDWALNNPPGRSGVFQKPRELQAYLGANTMSLGFAAIGTPGGGRLTLNLHAFETL